MASEVREIVTTKLTWVRADPSAASRGMRSKGSPPETEKLLSLERSKEGQICARDAWDFLAGDRLRGRLPYPLPSPWVLNCCQLIFQALQ